MLQVHQIALSPRYYTTTSCLPPPRLSGPMDSTAKQWQPVSRSLQVLIDNLSAYKRVLNDHRMHSEVLSMAKIVAIVAMRENISQPWQIRASAQHAFQSHVDLIHSILS